MPELVRTIEHYIEEHNRNPKPFIWTAKAADILAKVTALGQSFIRCKPFDALH